MASVSDFVESRISRAVDRPISDSGEEQNKDPQTKEASGLRQRFYKRATTRG